MFSLESPHSTKKRGENGLTDKDIFLLFFHFQNFGGNGNQAI